MKITTIICVGIKLLFVVFYAEIYFIVYYGIICSGLLKANN